MSIEIGNKADETHLRLNSIAGEAVEGPQDTHAENTAVSININSDVTHLRLHFNRKRSHGSTTRR